VATFSPPFAEYVASVADPDSRAALTHAWQVASAAAPEALEGNSYGMPALKLGASPLFAVQARARYLSMYPFSPQVLLALAYQLEGFPRTKGSVQFTAQQPIPDEVIVELVRLRAAEIAAR
jgi:uncharacterized protein YdhG (YjbR/CyaY superfamily)